MKRILTLALALILVLSALSLVACSKPDDTPDTPDGPNTPADDPVDPGKTDDKDDKDDGKTADELAKEVLATFPDRNYGGEEFTILASNSYGKIYIDQYTDDDKINGNLVHDALFERDKMIEAKFGLELVYDDSGDGNHFTRVSNASSSGDDSIGFALTSWNSGAINLLKNELIYDLNKLDSIDLTKEWWNQNSVEAMTINDICYMATGAITNRSVYAPYAVMFNNRLLEAAMLDNPYDLIERDDWTLETLEYNIMATAYEINVNGMLEPDDFFGIAPSDDSETAFFFAIGGKLADIDESGNIIAVYEDEHNFNLIETVVDFYRSDDLLTYKTTYDGSDAFEQGRAIFHSLPMCDITLVETEDPYGIVPMPKYDADQEEYISNTNKYITTMATIPISAIDPEKHAEIMDAMAAVSLHTSMDKQYETVMLNRQALDAESKMYLQMVVDSSSYDWVYMLSPEGVEQIIKKAILNGTELASSLVAVRDAVNTQLEEFMGLFE